MIQQAGPRPLGGAYSETAAAGAASRGLVYEPQREAAADRVAARATSGAPASAPVDVGGRAFGLQPAVRTEFLKTLISKLASGEGIQNSAAQTERLKGAAAAIRRDAMGSAIEELLKTKLIPALIANTTEYARPFDGARADIVKYIQAQASVIGGTIDGILETAAVNVPGAADGDPDLFYIRPRWLDLAVERFVYGELGLAVDVAIPRKSGRERVGKKELPVVDTSGPIKITLGSIFLPYVKDDSLWQIVLDNTFKNNTDYPQYNAADGPAIYKAAAKLILTRQGPRFDTFSRRAGKLRFLKATAKSIHGTAEAIHSQRTDAWPDPAEYAQPDPTKARGDVGMRVGDYNTWGPRGVAEREAHHITQFLLPEYLHNAATRQPFVDDLVRKKLYPGVNSVGSRAYTLEDSNGNQIRVMDAYRDHGGIMATVYLSRYTHQSPIHYQRSMPDEKDGHSGMSVTVDRVFREALTAALPNAGADLINRDQSKAKPLLEALAAAPSDNFPVAQLNTTRNSVKNAIFKASRTAYRDMKKDMSPKLIRAIFELEPAYYTAVDPQARTMDKVDLDRVFAAATRRNEVFATSVGFE